MIRGNIIRTFRLISIVLFTISLSMCATEQKKPAKKRFFEHRISFVVLNRQCFEDPGNNKPVAHIIKQRIQELAEGFNKALPYDSARLATSSGGLEYDAMEGFINITLQNGKRTTETLKNKPLGQLTAEDFLFIHEKYLFLKCATLFRDIWYASPELKLSTNMFTTVLNTEQELLFNHYQYDNDTSNKYFLPIADNYPAMFELLPFPHLINSEKAAYLLEVLQKNKTAINDHALEQEVQAFELILRKVILGEYTLIIKTYM